MIDRAKQRRPQTQTVDELVNRYDTLLAQVRKPNSNPFAKRALREQMAEIQWEILARQRERNRRDLDQGRDRRTMCNTPLPPHIIHHTGVTEDLDSMR